MADPLQAKLRAMLKDAKAKGFIREFSLRPGGRATIYSATEKTKQYTTNTLETMTALQKAGWSPEEES